MGLPPICPLRSRCVTADDDSGHIAVNALVNRSLRSNTCSKGDFVACPKAPCDDFISPSRCPSAYPWAYRPDAFDFCCASGDDLHGNKGVNSNPNRSQRSRSCKDNDSVHCLASPCADYPTEPLII